MCIRDRHQPGSSTTQKDAVILRCLPGNEAGTTGGNNFISNDPANDAAGAVLRTGDKEIAFPLVEATQGNNAYDVSRLMKDSGNVALDVGCLLYTSPSPRDRTR